MELMSAGAVGLQMVSPRAKMTVEAMSTMTAGTVDTPGTDDSSSHEMPHSTPTAPIILVRDLPRTRRSTINCPITMVMVLAIHTIPIIRSGSAAVSVMKMASPASREPCRR